MGRRVAEIDDDVAAPLITELKALAERKAAALRERDALVQRMVDRAEDETKFTSLAAWCQRVGANLDRITYDQKRLALHALDVHVRVHPPGMRDDHGNPLLRWEMTMAIGAET